MKIIYNIAVAFAGFFAALGLFWLLFLALRRVSRSTRWSEPEEAQFRELPYPSLIGVALAAALFAAVFKCVVVIVETGLAVSISNLLQTAASTVVGTFIFSVLGGVTLRKAGLMYIGQLIGAIYGTMVSSAIL